MRWETFSALASVGFLTHAFTLRTAEDTTTHAYQAGLLEAFGFSAGHCVGAEQTHGNGVAVSDAPAPGRVPGVDALATRTPGLPLVIRCADCAAVYLIDRQTPAIALIHSGKKGTQADVVGATLAAMLREFATDPRQCLAWIIPSIGPCHYEINLWDEIEAQLRRHGVPDVHSSRVCTACHPDRYYSYRAELGHTGRMLALLALT